MSMTIDPVGQAMLRCSRDDIVTVEDHYRELADIQRETEKLRARLFRVTNPVGANEIGFIMGTREYQQLYKDVDKIRNCIAKAMAVMERPRQKVVEHEHRIDVRCTWYPQKICDRWFWFRKVFVTQQRAKGTNEEWQDLRLFTPDDCDLVL